MSGLLGWLLDRPRLVNTFVTNVRGPTSRLSFMGARVSDAIPISGTYGNVTVSFAVLSYAGTLVVTVIADPDALPDLAALGDRTAPRVQGSHARLSGGALTRTPTTVGCLDQTVKIGCAWRHQGAADIAVLDQPQQGRARADR